MSDVFGPIVERLAKLQADLSGTPHFEWGTVTSVSPLAVQLDGDPAPLLGSPSNTVRYLTVGTRVRVEVQNKRITIIGAAGGDPVAPHKVLWSGGPYYMNSNQTVNLNDSVRDQVTGITLIWSEYSNGSADNWGWHYHFIPKAQRDFPSGFIPLVLTGGVEKRVYVPTDTTITGHANNVNVPNNKYVLREVRGV